MGAELGRISGPLLAANLLRKGADLAFETNLLYLDVNNGFIGIKTDTPSRDLTVNGTTHTTALVVDTQAEFTDLVFVDNRIQNPSGDIIVQPNQSLDPTVVVNELQTSKLSLVDRSVSTLNINDNIVLRADGTGRVVFNTTTVLVNGNLHATGNISFDGNITFGDNSSDNVVFAADINSNINPNYNKEYDLGNSSYGWKNLYVENVLTDTFTASTLTVNAIDTLLTQGNTIYVSVNGSDAYTGRHAHSTFRTVKQALSLAQPGDNIVVFPGTYEEIFPLTVPQGVSITGAGIRAVTITPTVGTNTKDAFLLNGETTVSQLSIKGVSYDSVHNTGYAFRFATGFKVTTRSPYIQNITVINQGPNAGPGALIDGSVADPTSFYASMLFHAVTFIVPDADAVTATNGSRVEWLNSFSYFAHRGIYLTTGTLGFASQGVTFGAELRSINSANVYGTYGAIADGADTLGYLIGHNFGYIGTGSDSQNDANLSLQANEVIQINGGVIHFDSMDHKGDYRVGEVFYVNQQTGQVSFNAQSINFNATGNITIDGPTGQIIVDATKVQVSNIRVHDNNIDSLIGPTNFHAQSGKIYLNTEVFVTGNINVSGDTKVSGNVFLGNTPYDLVTINPKLTQSINPGITNTYTLGVKTPVPEIWNVGYLTTLNVDGVTQLTNNTISTLTTNTDLQLVASGSGLVKVASTDVQIDNNLAVNGTVTINGSTNLKNTVIRSDTSTPGTTAGAMNYSANGTSAYFFRVYGPLHNDPPHANYDKVQAGWTCDQIPGSVVVSNVPDPGDNNESCVITITGGTFVQNTFYTFTGNIVTHGPSTVTLTGTLNRTGNTYITGLFGNNNIQLTDTGDYITGPNVKIQNNTISSTVTNSDIVFYGSTTGGVIFDNKLKIVDNVISNIWPSATNNSQKSIYFTPNGTGNVVIDSTQFLKVPYDNDATKVLSTSGELRQNSTSGAYEGYLDTGNESFTNVYSTDKKTYIIPELTVGNNDNVLHFVVNNVEKATIDSTQLTTSVMGVGNFIISGNTINNPYSGSDIVFEPTGSGSLNLNNLLFKDDTITNTLNSALTLQSTGTGYVRFPGTGAVVLPYGDNAGRRDTPDVGESRYNTQLNYMEVFDGTSWIPAVGTLGAAPLAEVLDIMDLWSLVLG